MLVFGGLGLVVAYRRRAGQAGASGAPATTPLSAEEEARLRAALAEAPDEAATRRYESLNPLARLR